MNLSDSKLEELFSHHGGSRHSTEWVNELLSRCVMAMSNLKGDALRNLIVETNYLLRKEGYPGRLLEDGNDTKWVKNRGCRWGRQ